MSSKELVFKKDNLPSGWVRTRIELVCDLVGGGTPSRKNLEYFKDGTIIWLTPTEINKEKILKINTSREKITELGLSKSSAKLIPRNAVLLTSRASIGYVAIAGTEVTTNQGFASFLCSKIINNYFLAYWLKGNTRILEAKATGTTFKEIPKSTIKKLYVDIPPLSEQKRIVAKIESIFTQIDAAQKRLEILASQVKSSSASLNALKNSVLKQAFEGKLVPQDSNDESAEVLLKKMHKDSKEALVFEKENLPIGWVKTRVELVCDLVGGGTPSRKNLEYFKDGTIIWLTPTEINKEKILKINTSKEKITELGLSKSSAKLIPQNAVLLTSRASIGYVAIAGTEVTTNQGFASFLCSKIINNYFLAYWLKGNKQILEAKATGTIFKEISKSAIKKLYVDIPPHPEQKRIVSKIESIFDRIDAKQKEIKKLELQLKSVPDSITALKGSILKLAFEGKLVPQDPNDEPASVLLEKIKSQKSKNA